MKPIEKDFAEFLRSVGHGVGMDEITMKLFSLLYISPDYMAMDELAKKTRYSLASVSNTMKMLEHVGIAQRKKKPGSRKVFFTINKNLAIMNIYKIEAAKKNLVNPAKEKLPEIIRKYKKKARDDVTKGEINSIENYYKQMLLFEEMLKKWGKDLQILSKKIEKEVLN